MILDSSADAPLSARLLQALSPDLRPSLLSAGSSCVFPEVLCPCPGQNVLQIDCSDCSSSHPRYILLAMSLGLFCYGNGLVVVQFSTTVMTTCYLLHSYGMIQIQLLRTHLKMQDDTALLHIYGRTVSKAIFHSHQLHPSSGNQECLSFLKFKSISLPLWRVLWKGPLPAGNLVLDTTFPLFEMLH